MNVIRLTKVANIIHFWDFFVEGFEGITRKAKEEFDLEQMQKTLFYLARLHSNAFVCIAVEDGEPVGFSILEEATPLFAPFRSCIARAVYHRPGAAAIAPMMAAFEAWAKEQGIRKYVITTRRHSGSAVRFFQSPKFGFRRGYITFEKDIS